MKCAIMQPTFLPWSGYFNLMASADVFVFLDDAQFQKSSWHNRNRIAINGEPHWLTVPVMHQSLSQSIMSTLVSPQALWRQKMVRQLSQVYAKHPFSRELVLFNQVILDPIYTSLAELNMALIRLISNKLNISCRILRSSELNIDGVRTQRLLDILKAVNATQYLSPQGSKEYLTEDGFTQQSDISLLYQDFEPISYPQTKSVHFIEKLSILDVVMNLGWDDAKSYIR
ncbi:MULTISPECIES: WbqC family protein [unclassified Arsukibacterium]|uniref:WbqC family protein n=1 Tax=unclassified Arsukibacterium TaxID=2635278 RepID=UPI000C902016|nr:MULTISPECIES: WbqC family protein [unclassified Arsukibacterium]MAA96316.1 hypothetical protein [Rheinheimera sp.]HAW93134.1 hypothetical protein [Candidatus Azambacteria bacterium]|tara:strand:+ start:9708 stop:10391 length:684 start_codon:yes stop_codon:yes gene_type:complete